MHKYGSILHWSNEDEAFIAGAPELPARVHGARRRSGNRATQYQGGHGVLDRTGAGVGTTGPAAERRESPLFVLSPWIASFGTSAWKNYERRAKAAVRQGKEYEEGLLIEDNPPTGMFAVLMDEILTRYSKTKNKPEIVLMGHSTGAIIISEYINTLLARKLEGDVNVEGDVDVNDLVVKIVFFGAAATISQFQQAIIPYLRQNQKAEFFNISLNRYNEEKTTWRGMQTMSLLEWLDGPITEPASHPARVMGKWENVMLALHTIPCEVRSRVHLKHLPSGEGYPRSHSELDEVLGSFNAFVEEHWRANSDKTNP